MASKTEKKRVGDVVLEELGVFGYCRRSKIAKDAEVLNIGSVVELDAWTAEVQTCDVFDADGTAGTFTITVWDQNKGQMVTTTALIDTATTTVQNTALDIALGVVGAVVMSGTIETVGSWKATYSGIQYRGINVPMLTIDASSWTGPTVVTFEQTTAGTDAPGDAILITAPENVWGICLENLGTISGDKTALFLVRGPAIVNANQLGINSLVLGEIEAGLLRLGIVARSEPTTSEFQTT